MLFSQKINGNVSKFNGNVSNKLRVSEFRFQALSDACEVVCFPRFFDACGGREGSAWKKRRRWCLRFCEVYV